MVLEKEANLALVKIKHLWWLRNSNRCSNTRMRMCLWSKSLVEYHLKWVQVLTHTIVLQSISWAKPTSNSKISQNLTQANHIWSIDLIGLPLDLCVLRRTEKWPKDCQRKCRSTRFKKSTQRFFAAILTISPSLNKVLSVNLKRNQNCCGRYRTHSRSKVKGESSFAHLNLS